MLLINSFQYGSSNGLAIKSTVVLAVCEVIDETYGRMPVAGVYEEQYFENHQVRIKHAIKSGKHFDESQGKTFVDIIDRDAIERIIEGWYYCFQHLYSPIL